MATKAEKIVAGLCGIDNIEEIEAWITRLRTEVADASLVDDAALKAAGAHGVVKMGNAIQDVIGTDADPDRETGKGPKTTRTWLGPWYEERSGEYRFRTLFPLWLERDQPNDRASLFGPLYYQRRSTKHDADVLFPLVGKLRDEQTRTLVVGPWAQRDAPGESDRWLAPLFFSGSRPGIHFLPHSALTGLPLSADSRILSFFT